MSATILQEPFLTLSVDPTQLLKDRFALRDITKENPTPVVDFEGMLFEIDVRYGSWPRPGQLYLAGRNTGWHLLTCSWVKWVDHVYGSPEEISIPVWVVPKEIAYVYDIRECFPVIGVLDL